MRKIKLISDETGEIEALLMEEKNPKTVQKIWDALPFTIRLNSWGDELYGTIPVKISPENSQEECEIGDIAYWLEGSGFCILFGKTPVSTSDKPRLISPGNVFAKIIGDASIFKKYSSLTLKVDKA